MIEGQFGVQSLWRDPEQPGRLRLIPSGRGQGSIDGVPLRLGQRDRFGIAFLFEDRAQAKLLKIQSRKRRSRRQHGQPLHRVAKFSNIPRPGMGLQRAGKILGPGKDGPLVLFSELLQEKARE